MEEVRKPSRLQRRGHRFFLRMAVPAELRPIVGKLEITRALGTGDYAEACRRLPMASAEAEAVLADARRRLAAGPATTLPEHEAKGLVLSWFWSAERQVQAAEVASVPIAPEEVLSEAMVDAAELAAPGAAFDPDTGPSVQHVARQILQAANVALDPAGADWRRFLELIRRAMLEQSRRGQARLQGEFGAELDPLFRGIRPEADPPAAPRGLTVAKLVDAYMDDPARAAVTAKTRIDYAFAFRVLREVVGADTLARDVGREQARAVRDLLASLPPNSTKRWPGAPLQRVVQMARQKGIPPMAPRTANATLTKIGTLWHWAIREEHVTKNVFAGLRMAEPEVHARDARLPFSPDQLARIFGSSYAALQGARRWVPLIALFTGLRLNEACSLQVEDVVTRDGVPVILVRPGDGKRIKTASARRIVPVHPELVRLGLLAYVEERRQAGGGALFPELKPDARGYLSDHLQKWFSRYLDAVGARAPRTSFHSFRHSFRDALREANAPRDVVLALGGWSTGHVADDYGGGLRPSTLARWIGKVRFPGLDLSLLTGQRSPRRSSGLGAQSARC
jgi:integrase